MSRKAIKRELRRWLVFDNVDGEAEGADQPLP